VRLLADTSALVALFLRSDGRHAAAAAFVRKQPSARFVLTDLILAEVVTIVRMRADARRAVAVARSFHDSHRYELLLVDGDLLTAAIDTMERFADKRLSLVDCASFAVLERLRLDGAFSFDRDFRDCGYSTVP
jgi:predicted nucleic acid-binding protein